jgi:ribosomal protein S6
MLKTYEISFWVRTAQDQEEVLESLRKLLENEKAEIIKETRLVRRKFSYMLEKESEGYFGTYLVNLEAGSAARLKEKAKELKGIPRLEIYRLREEKVWSRPRKVPPRGRKGMAQEPKEKQPIVIEELDKKLEEILKT